MTLRDFPGPTGSLCTSAADARDKDKRSTHLKTKQNNHRLPAAVSGPCGRQRGSPTDTATRLLTVNASRSKACNGAVPRGPMPAIRWQRKRKGFALPRACLWLAFGRHCPRSFVRPFIPAHCVRGPSGMAPSLRRIAAAWSTPVDHCLPHHQRPLRTAAPMNWPSSKAARRGRGGAALSCGTAYPPGGSVSPVAFPIIC